MKRYFLTRTMREKLLVVAFVVLAAGLWLLSAAGRGRILWQEARAVAASRAEQELWFGNRAKIEEQAARATAQLDASRTLNVPRLVGELSTLASQAGLSPEVSGQRTDPAMQFLVHSAQVSFRRVDLAALVKFYEEVSKRSPYVALEQVSLAIDRGSPGTVNATFRVVATELKP